MQILPWLPRPLIIFAPVEGKVTPCVQWYGQIDRRIPTEEQMLFPLRNADTDDIEFINTELWRVEFLGRVWEWNRKRPSATGSIKADGIRVARDSSIIRIVARPSYAGGRMLPLSFTCCVADILGPNAQYSPQLYENDEVWSELPKLNLDTELQEAWRQPYLDPKCTDIEDALPDLAALSEQYEIRKKYDVLKKMNRA